MVFVSEWRKVPDCESGYGGFNSPRTPKVVEPQNLRMASYQKLAYGRVSKIRVCGFESHRGYNELVWWKWQVASAGSALMLIQAGRHTGNMHALDIWIVRLPLKQLRKVCGFEPHRVYVGLW